MKIAVASLLLLLFAASSRADDWRKHEALAGLSEAAVEQLARDKLLVTSRKRYQVFDFYSDPQRTAFITSDSILAAYHRVLEESFRRLERARAVRMRAAVVELRNALSDQPEAKAALKILDRAIVLFDEDQPVPEKELTPRGFYDRSPVLRRYFRAVSWLQSATIPVKTNEERANWRELGYSLYELDTVRETFGSLEDFVGEAHHPWLFGPFPEKETKTLTLLAPADTADSLLFERTTLPSRPFPHSLEICTALGSGWAHDQLDVATRERVADVAHVFRGSSLFDRYFDCLRSLLDDPEPGAPDLFSGEAWEVKSCRTALAGWAQLRHTFTLHVRRSFPGPGESPVPPPGFVEPDPEFFLRLEKLVGHTRVLLKRHGAFGLTAERERIAPALLCYAKLFRDHPDADFNSSEFPWSELKLEQDLVHAGYLFTRNLVGKTPYKFDRQERLDAARSLESAAEKLLSISRPLDPEHEAALRFATDDLDRNWRTLEKLCRGLRSIAEKQLRGEQLGNSDTELITGYGARLGSIMFVSGFASSRDNAPRITDVHVDPRDGRRMHVGIARPREILLLYPFKGREVLCVGAVLPFHEFVTKEVLTDEAWKSMLDSDDPPTSPDWATRIEAK